MNLFEEFLSQMGIFVNDREDIWHIADKTEFVVVDNEEGDYGTIRYFDIGGSLLAVRIVLGGDTEDTMFTAFGIEKLTPLAKKWLDEKIEDMTKNSFKQ